MTLAITGATGQLGRRTAELLLERVDPSEVVLITRSPGRLNDLATRGVAVRAGDFDAPETLASAFAGVGRLLFVSTDMGEGRGEQQARAVRAAGVAGVAHIIYTSLPDPTAANPALPAASHAETEAAIRESGMAWTFLRNALYAEYRLPEAQAAIASGELRHDLGDGRTAFVAREDCAAAAAAVLVAGAAHENVAYDITGPALFGAQELAALYGRLGSTTVTPIAVSDIDLIAGATAAGVPEPAAVMLASFGQAIREGHLDQLSDAVATLTGRAPISLEDVLAPALGVA